MRSGWADINDAHVSFNSGYGFHHGHNHQDENSFTFYALGKTFINDPAYWPKYSYCHSTLKINGEEQWDICTLTFRNREKHVFTLTNKNISVELK